MFLKEDSNLKQTQIKTQVDELEKRISKTSKKLSVFDTTVKSIPKKISDLENYLDYATVEYVDRQISNEQNSFENNWKYLFSLNKQRYLSNFENDMFYLTATQVIKVIEITKISVFENDKGYVDVSQVIDKIIEYEKKYLSQFTNNCNFLSKNEIINKINELMPKLLSSLENDCDFTTKEYVDSKTSSGTITNVSELVNDLNYTTKPYVDTSISTVNNLLTNKINVLNSNVPTLYIYH